MPSIVNGTVADGRTAAAQTFSPLVRETENDLGGHENLSAIEWSLVEAYVGATVALEFGPVPGRASFKALLFNFELCKFRMREAVAACAAAPAAWRRWRLCAAPRRKRPMRQTCFPVMFGYEQSIWHHAQF